MNKIVRKNTLPIRIANLTIGGMNRILIQSMTNTKTSDVESTVKQILSLEEVGCDIIRVAILNEEDAKAINRIKERIHIPLVADIHFDYRLALLAIENGVDKLRINPGNIGSIERIKEVVDKCKEKNIPIRIGVNLASIDKDIEKLYGHSAIALVESAKKHIKILEDLDFHNIVISLKASNTLICIEAYEIASKIFDYPLHIGITEAGTKNIGTIRSSIGLGILLNEGIGDTLRVSLTANPLEEVKVAKEILSTFSLYDKPILVSCPTCGRTKYDMFSIVNEIEEFLDTIGNCKIKVAIMGCVVNGPGEASDADIGIAGGVDEAVLFKKGQIIKKVPQEKIINVLKHEILDLIKKTE